MTPKSLLQALKPASVWASRKSTLPILECFRFRDGKVLTNDINSQTTYQVEGIDGLDCCINVAALTRSLGAMPPDEPLRISTEKGRIVLRAGRSRHALPTLPADNMPTLEIPKDTSSFVQVGNLSSILKRLDPYQAPVGSVKYFMVCTHLYTSGGNLIAEATDGHRCARWNVGPIDGEFEALIPRVAANRLHDLASPSILVDEEGQTIHISDRDAITSIKLTAGRFPSIDRVIPTSFTGLGVACLGHGRYLELRTRPALLNKPGVVVLKRP